MQLANQPVNSQLNNVVIGYTGATITSTTTASNGSYSFANITGGKYYIEYTNIPN
jgi:hypothetical protein